MEQGSQEYIAQNIERNTIARLKNELVYVPIHKCWYYQNTLIKKPQVVDPLPIVKNEVRIVAHMLRVEQRIPVSIRSILTTLRYVSRQSEIVSTIIKQYWIDNYTNITRNEDERKNYPFLDSAGNLHIEALKTTDKFLTYECPMCFENYSDDGKPIGNHTIHTEEWNQAGSCKFPKGYKRALSFKCITIKTTKNTLLEDGSQDYQTSNNNKRLCTSKNKTIE
jgi:hypothetical protein